MTSASVAPLLIRPSMPTNDDELRSIYCRMRRKILDDNFSTEMADYLTQMAGRETASLWGVPDTAMNPLSSNTRQLVVPGLYGRTPTVVVPEGGELLMGPEGLWDQAGIWPRNQGLQYYTVGAGIWFRRLHLVDQGRGEGAQLVDRLVDPADVYVLVDEANPMVPVVFWELRFRTTRNAAGDLEQFYAWDQFDLRDPEKPIFRIVRCNGGGATSEDVTARVLGPNYVEGSYEWRTPDGLPFLPYVTYRAVDTGCFWPMWRRSLHTGTLRACAHWTFTSRSALFATGEHVIIAGPEELPGEVRHGEDGREQGVRPTQTMPVTPGMLTLLALKAGQQLQSVSIGPGVNLPNLVEFANTYGMLLAMGDGLHPTDATRQSANPSSGVALEINSESRREFSAQILPFFRASDTAAIRKAAWMMLAAGHQVVDAGYSIEYHTIALSPSEQGDLRADLEWKEKNGQASPIDVHLQLFPGKTREQAREAIVVARVEAAQIEAEIAKRLEAASAADGSTAPPAEEKPEPLNGAQGATAMGIVSGVAMGQFPRDAGIGMLMEFFQLSESAAEHIMGSVGNGFKPAPPVSPTPAPAAQPAAAE